MRILFMGTPDIAAESLNALIAAGHDICAVFTRADKPVGRKQILTAPPVKQTAEANGIPVYQPRTLRDGSSDELIKSLAPDIIVVVAYGCIIPPQLLHVAKYGCINLHVSLLPKYRGSAPIQWAVLNGDAETGVTIMQLDEGLDTGDMLLKGVVKISPETTGGELHDALSDLGAALIIEALRNLNNLKPEAQDDVKSCYAAKIDKAEAKLDFNLAAEVLERKIRAFNPYPATYFVYKGERFKVLKAEALDGNSGRVPGCLIPNDTGLLIECNPGMLLVTEIQRQGKKAMPTEELLRGFSFDEEVVLE